MSAHGFGVAVGVALALSVVGGVIVVVLALTDAPDRGRCLASHDVTRLQIVLIDKGQYLIPITDTVCDRWERP